MSQKQVDFFIVGVQKGGTTALDAMLRWHPDVQMAKVKEVHYFDRESTGQSPDFGPLHEHFDWQRSDVMRGEATPIYLYWRGSMRKLKAYNPDARIIVGLRHPIFRAYSHWRMEFDRKLENLSFIEAITSGRCRVATAPFGQHRVFSYVERGFYESQIRELKALFPASQIHFFRTDLLWKDPVVELSKIERFLGLANCLQEYATVSPTRFAKPHAISTAERLYLHGLYESTLASLDRLTDLDFQDWKSLDYNEPMSIGPG